MSSCDVLLTWGSIFRSISAFTPFLWVGTGRPKTPSARCPAEPCAAGHPPFPGSVSRRPPESCGLGFVPNEPGQQPGYQRYRPDADEPPGDERDPPPADP